VGEDVNMLLAATESLIDKLSQFRVLSFLCNRETDFFFGAFGLRPFLPQIRIWEEIKQSLEILR
jgi:hypothetical protein